MSYTHSIAMRIALLLVTWLVPALQEPCKSVPHVLFMGKTLANHSHLDIHLVGSSDSTSLQCHTGLESICDDSSSRDWHFPNGTVLPSSGEYFYQSHRDGGVDLKRNGTASAPSGTYQCCVVNNSSVLSCVEVHITDNEQCNLQFKVM